MNSFPPLTTICRPRRHLSERGSVLMVAIVLLTALAFAAFSWMAFIRQGQKAAIRDRGRERAQLAAESGVEQVVDYLNNPTNYTGAVPAAYTSTSTKLYNAPAAYSFSYAYKNNSGKILTKSFPLDGWDGKGYPLFAPYPQAIKVDSNGVPVNAAGASIVDTTGKFTAAPVVVQGTWLRDQANFKSSKIPTCKLTISGNNNLILKDPNGSTVASVTELLVINPAELGVSGATAPNDAVPPANLKCVGKVIATGRTPEGITVVVDTLLTENSAVNLASPGAIVSRAAAIFSGNFNVFWGDVMAKADIVLPNPLTNKVNDQKQDPWFHAYTMAALRGGSSGSQYADGHDGTRESSNADGFANTAIPSTAANYQIPYLASYLDNQNKAKYADRENLLQYQSNLQLPKFNYSDWKYFFKSFGLPYYFTGPDGTIYGIDRDPTSATYGQTVGKSFASWFNISTTASNYWDYNQLFAFIDSVPVDNAGQCIKDVNGVPIVDGTHYSRNPEKNPDGTKVDPACVMATISKANTDHSRGAILMAADMRASGGGGAPSWTEIKDPTGAGYFQDPTGKIPTTQELRGYNGPGGGSDIVQVNHNGLFYTWGQVDAVNGNVTVYGSMIAEGGYAAGGTPSVWYNYRMKDGQWLNLNQSVVRRNIWAIRNIAKPTVN